VKKAKRLALQNICDIGRMAEWNCMNGIHCYRLSSDIFPRFTDKEVENYSLDFARSHLKFVGDYGIKKCKQRFLMHPAQFNQVGALRREVFESTVLDLGHHADILDAMGMGVDGVLIVHGGGTYGDKEKTKKRWIKQFFELPENVKRRLVLENCEKCYNVEDCLEISEATGVPVVYDCHHYECYNLLHPEYTPLEPEDFLPRILETWTKRGIRPVMHVSEQRPDSRVGAHSDYIETIPQYMIDIPLQLGIPVDIEVEAKMKEKAIFKLREKYGF